MAKVMASWGREYDMANRSGVLHFFGQVNLGATGVISSQDCPRFKVTKTGSKTGRYDVQLLDPDQSPVSALKLCSFNLAILTASADAAYTTAKAVAWILRNNSISPNGTFQFQLVRTDTNADAEAEDSAVLFVEFDFKISGAVP